VIDSASGDGTALSVGHQARRGSRAANAGALIKALYLFPAAQAGVALALDRASSTAVVTSVAGGTDAFAMTLKPTPAPTPAPTPVPTGKPNCSTAAQRAAALRL
jgi:hypothetical protein